MPVSIQQVFSLIKRIAGQIWPVLWQICVRSGQGSAGGGLGMACDGGTLSSSGRLVWSGV